MTIEVLRHTVSHGLRASALLLALAAVLSWDGATAQAAEEVNIYSLRQPFLIEPILQEFTRRTGIRTNVVHAPQGLVERIRQEGRNSPADVLLTVDIGRLHDAAEAGVLQPVRTPTLEANIPAPYRHPQGLWYALTFRARVIFASKDRVKPEELDTYEGLTAPRWKGRICTRSSQHDYNIALLASLIAHHGETAAEQWARGLLANLARKPQGNDRAQVKAIKEGECDIALVNTYYMGAMLEDAEQRAWAEAVYLYFPNQGGRGAHVNVSGAGITRSAPHKANAVKLLEFLSSALAQQLYAEHNFEYPVNPDVPWSPLVASWGRFKPDTLPLVEIATHREAALRMFDRVNFP
ncbi:MAG: Fe(3+) ABC transporter substrate-binding protein [Candidatus Lambdaproteobacteria bacterium]|nr:Fe(3+) ABC transporter substrate-binding protein [Candidatus Lambdaproteobacteria bacterium]